MGTVEEQNISQGGRQPLDPPVDIDPVLTTGILGILAGKNQKLATEMLNVVINMIESNVSIEEALGPLTVVVCIALKKPILLKRCDRGLVHTSRPGIVVLTIEIACPGAAAPTPALAREILAERGRIIRQAGGPSEEAQERKDADLGNLVGKENERKGQSRQRERPQDRKHKKTHYKTNQEWRGILCA